MPLHAHAPQGIVSSAQELQMCRGHRGFKALKQIVKLHYKLGNTNDMLKAYRRALLSPRMHAPQLLGCLPVVLGCSWAGPNAAR